MPDIRIGVRRARERIAASSQLNAFISLTAETGDGPAVAVKDVIDVAGMVTTFGTRLPGPAATRDALVVERIRRQGGVIVGKTNLQPWAFGVTSANPNWGDVRNPADPDRIPGGSSGGSAAAVAAGMCDWALGTDTGGSVRIPAALCGVVGFMPTHGLVGMSGVAPLAPSLDTMGILAPDVATAARAFEIISGKSGLVPGLVSPLGAGRLVVPEGWVAELDSDVSQAWSRIVEKTPGIPFPERIAMAHVAMTILLYEAAAVHSSKVTEHPQAYDPGVRTALERGLRISAEEYASARAAQREAWLQVQRAMAGFDALVLPTVGRTAPRIGEKVRDRELTRYTLPFNFTGQPAISLPVYVTGLPVGIQLVGRRGADAALLAVALSLEEAWRSV